jgi:hypothetical protein
MRGIVIVPWLLLPAVLLLGLLAAFLLGPVRALAQVPQDYTSDYNVGGLYTDTALIYEFSGLDSTVEYTWKVERVNDNDAPIETVGTWSVGPGSATATRFINYWPSNIEGPLRVVDHWGQVVGRHYITAAPHSEWFQTNAVNTQEKSGVALVVYNDVDANNYQHDETNPESVLVASGDRVLFHYRTDALGTTDVIRLVDIDGGATVAEYPLSELYDFNGGGGSTEDAFRFWSYVVLSTDGTPPTWIDGDKSSSTFTVDNPHTLVLPAGAYEYARLTSAGALVAEGESILLVSSDPRPEEWTVTLRGSVSGGDPQTLRLRASTEAIWDALDSRTIEDSLLGSQLAVIDAWALVRHDQYLTAVTSSADATSSWCLAATALTWATASERRLCESADYLIRPNPGLTPRLENLLQAWDLNDDLGHLMMFTVGVVLSLVAAHRWMPSTLGSYRYIAVYLLLAGAALISQWLTGWVALVIGLTLLLLVVLLVMGVLTRD